MPMNEPNSPHALRAMIDDQGREIERIWNDKASKESVDNLKTIVQELRTDMREEVGGLRKTLLVVSGAWLFGTLMFLLAALEFTQ